jgi:DNA repair protein RecO (recombination protein O)
MVLVTTDAVVLHAFDYLETSRIVRLATRDGGVQSVIARGARRSTKRFGAALDLFASGVAEIHTKAGRDLQQLTAFDITRARPSLGADLDRFAAASMLAELGLKFSSVGEQGDVFSVLTGALDALQRRTGVDARLTGLGRAWHLVASLGFAPVIDTCCICHEPVGPDQPALFSHANGGIACQRCAVALRGGRRIPPEARSALRAWLGGDDARADGAQVQRAHARLLKEFAAYHLSEGAELRAFESWMRRFGAS